MRNRILNFLFIIILAIPASLLARNDRDTLGSGHALFFSENRGQWVSNVRFRAQMHSVSLFMEEDCFTVLLQHPDNANLRHFHDRAPSNRFRTHAYRMRFVGCSTQRTVGVKELGGYENYFLGRDASHWATGVKQYAALRYEALYPGIDMMIYSDERALKYDFVVAPGTDPSCIVLLYEGVDGVKISGGNLLIHTSVRDVIELKPYAYQEYGGERHEVTATYQLQGETVRFQLGVYDTSHPLIIDPYLYFSTYTGATSDNWGTTAAYDSYKNTYSAGLSFDVGYPCSLGAYDSTYNGNTDIGIFKFDSTGSQRLYATYLGGNKADMPHSLYVNAFDELVIFGTTGSANFPVSSNAFDTSFNGGTYLYYEGSSIPFPNGSDIFVSRFSSDGTQLQASTYVGGSGNDGLNFRQYYNNNNTLLMLGNDSLYFNYGDGARGELITDDLNNIYVGSTTFSLDFPTTQGVFQPMSRGQQEGIVFKLDYNLSHLMWSSYLGGYGDDAIYSIDVDNDYNLLVCGGTNSVTFPTTAGSYRTFYNGGSADGFVAKISYYGNTLMASTTFGSNAYDQCYFVRCGKQDDVFLFGQTKASGSTLVQNANYNTPNSGQFLARFSPNLDVLRWSTVFGTGNGEPNISPSAFMADICNRVYLAGWGRKFCGYYLGGGVVPWNSTGTWGMTVTSNAYQSTTDGQDFYLMSLADDASQLIYASFFGEPHSNTSSVNGNDHVDGGTSRFDRTATLYQAVCASCGGSDNFPTTTGAWSQHNNCDYNCNNAIFRINLSDDFPVAEFVAPPSGCAPYTIQFHNTGRGSSYHWDFGDGTTSTAQHPTHTYSTPGTYTVTLIAQIPMGCKTADTLSRQVVAIGNQSYHLDTLSTCPGIPLQIGTTPMMGCQYRWIGSQGWLSDTSIANPYTHHSGDYMLIISNGTCTDTVFQTVLLGHAQFEMPSDTSLCVSPLHLDVQVSGSNIQYYWSSRPDFSDTLNGEPERSFADVELDSSTTFYLHVIDDFGCEETDSIRVSFVNILDSLAYHDALCPDACNGSATLTAGANATPPFSYQWDNGAWSSAAQTNTLCSGVHTAALQDSRGCRITKTFTISAPERPILVDSITHVLCHENCTGTISLSVIGNNPPYTIEWLDDGSVTAQRTDLCPGTYIARITDASSCVFLDTLTVLENANMQVDASFIRNSCPDLCSGQASALAQGGTPPYSYQWCSGAEGSAANNLCEGWCTVNATDATGCTVRDSVWVDLLHSFDSLEVWADDEVLFEGESTTLHATHIPGASYLWQPATSLTDAFSEHPTATPTDTTTYIVTVTDSAGCVHTDSVRVCCILVDCGRSNIIIPNVFTPNGDGINDKLCFRGDWIKEFYIAIFTRWGEMVYESSDINGCWDGQYKNNWCLPGVYTYRCKVTCEGDKISDFKGDITLIR